MTKQVIRINNKTRNVTKLSDNKVSGFFDGAYVQILQHICKTPGNVLSDKWDN